MNITPDDYAFRFSVVQLAANILADGKGILKDPDMVVPYSQEICEWITHGIHSQAEAEDAPEVADEDTVPSNNVITLPRKD